MVLPGFSISEALMLIPLLLILIFGGWLFWFFNRTAKRVIVTPVKDGGVISQQSFLAEKTVWKVLWESDAVNLMRLVLDLLGLAILMAWLWG